MNKMKKLSAIADELDRLGFYRLSNSVMTEMENIVNEDPMEIDIGPELLNQATLVMRTNSFGVDFIFHMNPPFKGHDYIAIRPWNNAIDEHHRINFPGQHQEDSNTMMWAVNKHGESPHRNLQELVPNLGQKSPEEVLNFLGYAVVKNHLS